MSCPSGQFINASCGFYGRANTVYCFPNQYCASLQGCGILQNTQCSSTTALGAVQNQCNGRQTCSINVDGGAGIGGDPCGGTLKYATFDYTCYTPTFSMYFWFYFKLFSIKFREYCSILTCKIS